MATLNVGVGETFTSIQDAVNAASSGDTILVAAGTYNENVTIDKSLTLASAAGAAATSIVGQGGSALGTVLVAPGVDNVTIGGLGAGFTIIGIDNASPGIESAAIYLQGAHNALTIQGNNVVANGDAGLTGEFGYVITNILIDSNEFSGQTFVGIPADFGFGNQFTTPNVPRQLVVLGSNNSIIDPATPGVTFTNNDVTGTAGGINASSQPQGNTLVTIDVANSVITDNTFSGFTNRFATQLRAREENTTITDNEFSTTAGGNLGIFAAVAAPETLGTVANNTYVLPPGVAIQTLINLAQAGDTIVVPAGTYNESLTINKAITILGPNDGIAGDGSRIAEAIITGQSTITAGASLSGLTFENGSSNSVQHVALNVQTSANVTIEDSRFVSTGPNGNNEDRAILLGTAASGNVTIDGNYFGGAQTGEANKFSTANWQRGIWSDGTTSGLTITNNVFENVRTGINIDGFTDAATDISSNSFETSGTGISIGTPTGTTYAGIHDNTFTNVSTDLNLQNVTATISIDLAATNNTAVPGGTDTAGVMTLLTGTGADSTAGSAGADFINSPSGDAASDVLSGGGGNDTIVGSGGGDTLTGGAGNDSLVGGAGTDTATYAGPAGDYTIIYDGGGAVVGVTDNNLGNGDEGSDTLSGIDLLDFGGSLINIANPVQVLVNGALVSTHTTIQDGIDAAAVGAVVKVAAGTYNEAVVVNKQITLDGAGTGTIVTGGIDIAASGADAINRVVVRDLTVSGAGGGDGIDIGAHSYVTVDNVTVESLTGYSSAVDINFTGTALDIVLDGVTANLAGGQIGLRVSDMASVLGLTVTDSTFNGGQYGFYFANDTLGAQTVSGTFGGLTFNGQTSVGGDGFQSRAMYLEKVSESTFTDIDVVAPMSPAANLRGINLNLKNGHFANISFSDVDITGFDTAQTDTSAYRPLFVVGVKPGATLSGITLDDITAVKSASATGSGRIALDVFHEAFPAQISGLSITNSTITGDMKVQTSVYTAISGNTVSGNLDLVLVNGSNSLASNAVGGTVTLTDGRNATLPEGVDNLVLFNGTLIGQANNNQTGTGNTGDNTITGNDGNNLLSGLGGNDSLVGGLGNDTLDGGDNQDTLVGGANADSGRGGAGNDWLQGDAGNDTLDGGADNDTLTGGDDLDVLSGGLGDDSLLGDGGNDTLQGGDGSDTLVGGLGTDSMVGGLGDDLYIVTDASDIVFENGTGGIDTVQTTLGSYSIALLNGLEHVTFTGTGNFAVTGNNSANALAAGTGNDVLNGGVGADTLTGGSGIDTYVVDNIGDVIVEAAGDTGDLVQASISYSLVGTNIERLELTGTSSIAATGNDADNTLTGNSGSNLLDGGLGADTLDGGSGGNDTYVVDSLGDVVIEAGASTSDLVRTTLASFDLSAYGTIERLEFVGAGAVDFTGTGNASANVIVGDAGHDTLSGGALNDTLTGGLGNDVLDGGTGIDSMTGGEGNDIYYVDSTTDRASETIADVTGTAGVVEGGIDQVLSTATSFTLGANVENLTLMGAAVTGIGNTVANQIVGTAGANSLSGSTGDDTLVGGGGADSLLGGTQNDLIRIADAGAARIDGSTGQDVLQLDGAFNYDLTAVANTAITGIEVLDLGALGNNQLTLGIDDVRALSAETWSALTAADAADSGFALARPTDSIVIRGTVGDSVQLTGATGFAGGTWQFVDTTTFDGENYAVFDFKLGGVTQGSVAVDLQLGILL